MTHPRFSAILFDLDGTLVDSLRDIAESVNEVLATRRLPVHPQDAYKIFVGDGMSTLVQRCLPPEISDCDSLREEILREIKQVYATRWKNNALPYPGIRELLRELAASALRLGILSNKPDAFTRAMVRFVFPDVAWATVRGAVEGVPLKPNPDAALGIAREWGISPTDILYVGDTSTDMLTARNAGMPSVGVTWGFRDREELLHNGAAYLADHPHEIAAIFGR